MHRLTSRRNQNESLFGADVCPEAFFSKLSERRLLQSMGIVTGPCWTNFCSQKLKRRILANGQAEAASGPFWKNFCSQILKRRILATLGFNTTALRATQPKVHSMFCELFLKIAVSAAELMSFGRLGAAICHRWTIVCDKISVMPTTYIHSYIIGHYNPSVRIIDPVSHTTYVVCIIFWETFHGNSIYSQSFCQKYSERKSPKKYFSYFVLMSGVGLEPWLFVK